MNKTVLISGGAGLLALNWGMKMRSKNSVILGLHERQVTLAGVQSQPIDLESVTNLQQILEELSPGMMVHTAGLTSVETCEKDPQLANHINVTLAVNAAKACAKSGVPFVQISTDHLFSGTESMVDETHPTAPLNVYAQTKAAAEQRVLDVCPDALVIRTNFYGWGPSYRKSFSDTIIEKLRAKKTITLFTDVFYTPILAGVVAETVTNLVSRKANGIFNVVGDDRISKYAFGQKLATHFQLDNSFIRQGELTQLGTGVQRPRDMSLSNKKAATFLGMPIGSVDTHLAILRDQETSGIATEIQNL